MGRTLRTQVALYLDADRVKLLARLALKTGRTKQALLREALDDVLIRHKPRAS
jgi:predicted transcriptional regulator